MLLKKLEAFKKVYKKYATAIDSVERYIHDLVEKYVNVIAPRFLSKRIEVLYPDTLPLLFLLADEPKVIRKAYQVFSSDDYFPLGEFDTPDEIPDTLPNPATGEEVDRENFVVDLVFHLPQTPA